MQFKQELGRECETCMRSTVHDLPSEPQKWHALHDDRNPPDLHKDQEYLPDVFAQLGVGLPTQMRGSLGAAEPSTHERREWGVLHAE